MDMMQEIKENEGKRELEKLLQWITENGEQWLYICEPDFFDLSVKEQLELIRSLKEAGLYSVAYLVFCSIGGRTRELECARNQFWNEIIVNVPVDTIMERMDQIVRNCLTKHTQNESTASDICAKDRK